MNPPPERTPEQAQVWEIHNQDNIRVPNYITRRWGQPPPAGNLDINSLVTCAVSTSLRSTVILFAIGSHSAVTRNTFSRNGHNPWLIFQHPVENRALAQRLGQHITDKWQEMQVPNGQRDRVDQIAKHVVYEYDRETESFILRPLRCSVNANVSVYIKDIEIWSHPPRDKPLLRVLQNKPCFKQTEANLRGAARRIRRICENPKIPTGKRDEKLQSQKCIVRQKFKEYYHKFFWGWDRRKIPDSYLFPTLQLSLQQQGDQPAVRYGNTMAGVYGKNDDAVHHKFSASGIPRFLPSEEEVFDDWSKFPSDCGLTYAELFQGECF